MGVFDFDATFGDDYLHFYLPMLTPERNETDASEIVAALELTSGQRVLDAPCGHGRISNLLARAGMNVIGIDRSALFLEIARRNATAMGVEVDYRLGDLTDLASIVPEQFDAAINWFTSFGYHDDDTLRSILAAYRNVLRPGGQLLIETLNHDWFVRHHVEPPFTTVTAVGDDVMYDIASFDPATGRVETVRTVHRDGQSRTSQHFVRLPTSPEWKSWLHDAGFHNIRITAREASELTLDSRRTLIVATA
jgi:SAM-dependent methyltransferase